MDSKDLKNRLWFLDIENYKYEIVYDLLDFMILGLKTFISNLIKLISGHLF